MTSATAQALLRSFTRSLWLVAGGLILLTGLLAAGHYRAERDRAWNEARTTTTEQAARLGALVSSYTRHVERMRAFMQDSLARGETALPAEIVRRLYTVAPGGDRFGGTFLRDPASSGEPPYGVVAASTLLAARGADTGDVPTSADNELASAMRLLFDLHVEFAANPALSRSYYNSTKLDLAVSYPAYPLEQTRASAAAAGATSADEFLVIRPAGSAFWRLGPERNPKREFVWTDAYVDRGGAGAMITLAAPVYSGDVYHGAAATDVPLAAVTRFLQQAPPTTGQVYVLTPEGAIIGSSEALPAFELTQLASRVPSGLATAIMAAPSGSPEFVAADSWRALIAEVEGTPWRVVFAAPEAAMAWSVAPELLGYGVALTTLLLAACAGLWSFRQRFLRPAVSIFEAVQANDDESLIVRTRSTPWQPVADIVAQVRAANRQALSRIEDDGRLKSAVFEASLDCIITADEQGRVLDCNPAVEQVFGYGRDQMIGRPMSETIVPQHHRAAHETGFRRYVSTGQKRVLGKRVEIEGLRVSGEVFPLELTIAEAKVGTGRMFVAFIRDLTKRKAVEAEMARQREALYQKEKMAALGSLLAGVSHELNNPLSVVVGRASMLEEDLDEPRLRDSVQRLRAAAERCGRIVRTFLAMARHSKPKRHAVQINAALDAALEIAGYGLRSSGVEVRREYAADLPQVLADEDQLAQVFMNLIVNAQHAMEQRSGPRRLTIRTRLVRSRAPVADMDDGPEVVVDIQDTGTGIPDDLRQRIFEPFFTTKKQGKGTGLGLAVSQGMVQAHGGRIDVASAAEGGSIFSVRLPVHADTVSAIADAEAARPGGPAASAPPLMASSDQDLSDDARPRALIVDEETEVGSMLAEVLRADGYSCTVVDSARKALALLDTRSFDVILSDLRMPEMNGYQFATALSERRPGLVERMLFVTGDALGDLRSEVESLGRPVIDKPFSPSELREALARVSWVSRSSRDTPRV